MEDLTGRMLGSYILQRQVARGGTGTVWEGWLNPFAELGFKMLSGERKDLWMFAGVKPKGESLAQEDRDTIRRWLRERTDEFINNPERDQIYNDLLNSIAQHRRIAGDFRRAIKVLDEYLTKDSQVVKRFENEVDFLVRLDHPSIVKVVESGQDDGIHFCAMEFVETVDLEAQKPSIPDACKVISKALQGLIYAHSHGILHRDIKPANILVTRDYAKVKLTDFGIAKALDDTMDGQLTATGIIVGTPNYMDPERARGINPVKESDVYSLGATFYRLLTGQVPVVARGARETVQQIAQEQEIAWVRSKNQLVSKPLERLVGGMLSKDYKKRLSTFEVRYWLNRIMEDDMMLHQDSTKSQYRGDMGRVRVLRQLIKKLKLVVGREPELIKKVCEHYENLCELLCAYDDSERGMNVALDALEEADAFYRSSVKQLRNIPNTLADRGSMLEKKADIQQRRLRAKGFKRRSMKPHTMIRRGLVVASVAAIVIMAALFGRSVWTNWTARSSVGDSLVAAEAALSKQDYPEAHRLYEKARGASGDLPTSSKLARKLGQFELQLKESEAYDQARKLYQAAETALDKTDFQAARKALAMAEQLSQTLVNPRVLFQDRVYELSRRVDNTEFSLKAKGALERARAHLVASHFYQGANELDLAVEAIARLRESRNPEFETQVAELKLEYEKLRKTVSPRLADIRIFRSLVETADAVKADSQVLREGLPKKIFFTRWDADSLKNQISNILEKLIDRRVLDPSAIGPEYDIARKEIERTHRLLLRLPEELAKAQLDYLLSETKVCNQALTETDPAAEEYPKWLTRTEHFLTQARSMLFDLKQDRPGLGEARRMVEQLRPKYRSMKLRRTEFERNVAEANRGNEDAVRSVLRSLVRARNFTGAARQLGRLEKTDGYEDYLTIVDSEQSLEQGPPANGMVERLAEAYRRTGFKDRATETLAKYPKRK